jgi:hypothetical protein
MLEDFVLNPLVSTEDLVLKESEKTNAVINEDGDDTGGDNENVDNTIQT